MRKEPNENYMTVGEMSRFLGISQTAAYELAHSEDFPVCRFGGAIRIPRPEFAAWIEMKTSVTPRLRAYMAAN